MQESTSSEESTNFRVGRFYGQPGMGSGTRHQELFGVRTLAGDTSRSKSIAVGPMPGYVQVFLLFCLLFILFSQYFRGPMENENGEVEKKGRGSGVETIIASSGLDSGLRNSLT